MTATRSARFQLRNATAAWHDRVDAAFSAADLSERGSYGRFLAAQAAAHVPVERALDIGGIAAIVPDWDDRRRAALIAADLAALGLPLPTMPDPPILASRAALLGALYVLEGSRLGGALLRRSVPGALPTRFLSAAEPGAWRKLIALLDARLSSPDAITDAIAAACDVFALFEESGRQLLEGVLVAC